MALNITQDQDTDYSTKTVALGFIIFQLIALVTGTLGNAVLCLFTIKKWDRMRLHHMLTLNLALSEAVYIITR